MHDIGTRTWLRRIIMHVVCDMAGRRTNLQRLVICLGDPTRKDAFITCNGYRLPVTVSLYNALREIRCPDKGICLWVDAVCIDQANLDERAKQVMRIGQSLSLLQWYWCIWVQTHRDTPHRPLR